MTIQMREGWVLLRNGEVDYAEVNVQGQFVKSHPWRLRHSYDSVRNDGRVATINDDTEFDEDIIELLDPWDARVPEEHREKRFVVGTHLPKDGHAEPCVFDRQRLVGAAFPVEYFGSGIERITAECNADFESGRAVGFSWSPKHMLTIDGKPCNPDGSPIAEQPKPVDEPAPAVEPEPLPYDVVDPASRFTRTLRTDHYGVYAECRDGSEPVVEIVANAPPGCSVAQARALVAMILAVCEEIER